MYKVMLTWKVSHGKRRNIGNVSFSVIKMVLIVFLICIQVQEKVVRKTDGVRFINLRTFNTLLTFLIYS